MPRKFSLDMMTSVVIAHLVEVNSFLKARDGPYYLVLRPYKICHDKGCHIIERGSRHNAQAKKDKLDAYSEREVDGHAQFMTSK